MIWEVWCVYLPFLCLFLLCLPLEKLSMGLSKAMSTFLAVVCQRRAIFSSFYQPNQCTTNLKIHRNYTCKFQAHHLPFSWNWNHGLIIKGLFILNRVAFEVSLDCQVMSAVSRMPTLFCCWFHYLSSLGDYQVLNSQNPQSPFKIFSVWLRQSNLLQDWCKMFRATACCPYPCCLHAHNF